MKEGTEEGRKGVRVKEALRRTIPAALVTGNSHECQARLNTERFTRHD